MADIIDYEILGDSMQAVIIELDPQEGVQTLPFSRLADRVVAASGLKNKGESKGIAGLGGGILGGFLQGDR